MSPLHAAATQQQPVVLETEQAGDKVRISIVGHSDHPVTVRYRLEAESGPGKGGNRSAQGGIARLDAGDRKTLISLTLGGATQGTWTARLFAEVEGGESYEIEKRGG